MREYNSLEEIAYDLKKADLERKIAQEELILKYNDFGSKVAKGFMISTAAQFGISLLLKVIAKRFK